MPASIGSPETIASCGRPWLTTPDTQAHWPNVNLVIVHYHLRPGGIRRVLELAVPHLLRHFGGRIRSIVVATGEARDRAWNERFTRQAGDTPVRFFVEPSFGYASEQRPPAQSLPGRIRAALNRLLAGPDREDTVVWAHNLGVGRNLVLTRELARACQRHGIALLAHHHDWWLDNRWQRWPELRRFGTRTLAAAARTVFPEAAGVRHLTINQADTRLLQPHLGRRVAWLPNLMDRSERPAPTRVRAAAAWLRHHLDETRAPAWILPCRLLRRKNVAEALLLVRWLRPEAWLVTTGGVSSADETAYANRLAAAARRHGWPLRLGLLAGNAPDQPTVPELLAASECVLLTSIQEGFGLPYLEAAAAGRPLIARSLPNIAPDLYHFGFRFPQSYGEVRIAPDLFDWRSERTRQRRLFRRWLGQLPRGSRALVSEPDFLRRPEPPGPVPFSRLTLAAQIEVLARPVPETWERCLPLNPFLRKWRDRAAAGRLRTPAWPKSAARWLSGPAYARRWADALAHAPLTPLSAEAAQAAQRDFIAWKLRPEYLYPLLWTTDS